MIARAVVFLYVVVGTISLVLEPSVPLAIAP